MSEIFYFILTDTIWHLFRLPFPRSIACDVESVGIGALEDVVGVCASVSWRKREGEGRFGLVNE